MGVLVEIALRSKGDFSYDADAVLMEMPNTDADLEVLIRKIKPAEAASAG